MGTYYWGIWDLCCKIFRVDNFFLTFRWNLTIIEYADSGCAVLGIKLCNSSPIRESKHILSRVSVSFIPIYINIGKPELFLHPNCRGPVPMALTSSPSSSFSALFDDSDWELTNADDVKSIGGDAEWVITGDEGYYVPGRSMSTVFLPQNGQPLFASLQLGSSTSSDPGLPPFFIVSASSGGLVLSRGPWSSYCVSNPSTGACSLLPRPPGPHYPGSPLAIVRDGPSYHVVCAVSRGHEDSHSFSVFSSARGAWCSSKVEFALAPIVPNSGVSCSGFAYWRTESRMILEYDVLADQARTLVPPAKPCEAGYRWQLGRAGEKKLCCVLVMGSNLEVYELGVKDQWALLCSIGIEVSEEGEWDGREPIVCRRLPRALRFESHELEVLLLVDGKLVVLGLENRRMRVVQFEKPAPDRCDDYVVCINDSLASVDFTVEPQPVK